MTLATKNSINKNVAVEIKKSMVFLTPFSNYELLPKSTVMNGKKLYSSNQGKAENFYLENFHSTQQHLRKATSHSHPPGRNQNDSLVSTNQKPRSN